VPLSEEIISFVLPEKKRTSFRIALSSHSFKDIFNPSSWIGEYPFLFPRGKALKRCLRVKRLK